MLKLVIFTLLFLVLQKGNSAFCVNFYLNPTVLWFYWYMILLKDSFRFTFIFWWLSIVCIFTPFLLFSWLSTCLYSSTRIKRLTGSLEDKKNWFKVSWFLSMKHCNNLCLTSRNIPFTFKFLKGCKILELVQLEIIWLMKVSWSNEHIPNILMT